MKLIIDISEDAYEARQFLVSNPKMMYNEVDEAIANGTPYEERPKGKWEFVQYDANPNIGNWHCSNCNGISDFRFKYCPNCGADMRGDV